MSDPIGYLPGDLDSRLRLRTNRLTDTDTAWEITRLAEAAYARGMQDGFVRGMTDTAQRAAANEKRRAESHTASCPARQPHPDCACATPPEEPA